ncbi:unnamed protein product [Rhodiola kirilowii]
MPTNTELIASHGTAIENIEGRLGPIEGTLNAVVTSPERLTKSMEDMQQAFKEHQNPPVPRPDKQPIHNNPPLLPTPTHNQQFVISTHDPQPLTPPTTSEINHRPPRAPRLEIPIFDGTAVEGWLFQLERFFDIHETPPEQMLYVAPLYMIGEALKWFQWKTLTGQVTSWIQLTRDLRRRFAPGDYYDAEVEINKLLQTASVATYVSAFESLSTSTPAMSSHNLLKRFLAGLKEEILREIVLLRPTTLEDVMGMSRVAEDKIRAQRSAYFRPSPFRSVPASLPPLTHPNPTTPHPTRPTYTPLPVKKLTPLEMAARREKGLCYNCDDRFTSGQKCRPRFQSMIVEDDDLTVTPDLISPPHDEPFATDQTPAQPLLDELTPCITFHAMQGKPTPSTIRFHGYINE